MTLDKKFYPGLNRLLVSMKDLPKNDSGLLLTTSTAKYAYGTIEAVGSIKDSNTISSSTFNVGDNVYFLAQSGTQIELDNSTYRLLAITEVLVGEKQSNT